MALSTENFSQGFLVDEELMAGVTQHPENPSIFIAFILQHTTGEYLGYQPFNDVDGALNAINQIKRSWTFERLGGCGGCSNGSCGQGKCGGGACKTGQGVCPT